MRNNKVIFEPLQQKDLEKLYEWFQTPFIKKWWCKDQIFSKEDIEKKYLPRLMGKENVPSFIIYLDNKAIGFIQYYILKDFLPEAVLDYQHPLFQEAKPEEIAGLDIFIGEAAYLNKGFAVNALREFSKKFIAKTFKIAVVDPWVDNHGAIHFFKKCGFTVFCQGQSKAGLQHLIMLRTFEKNLK